MYSMCSILFCYIIAVLLILKKFGNIISMKCNNKTKFIFVTGGVVSSLGKGIVSASIGALLKSRGLNISVLKLDPYLNIDPGTMNPFQHGEVFVTDDGAETDLDLGHYERYISVKLNCLNSKSAGQIYLNVLEKERQGKYLGETVQVIPHITDEIKNSIYLAGEKCNILICEVGGTVGDIESLPFIEAIRQIRQKEGIKSVFFIHVSYLPYIDTAGEVKTKPTQHSVKALLGLGIQPDLLLLRSKNKISNEIKSKISLFCNVPLTAVANCPDLATIYEAPLILRNEHVDQLILEHLNIESIDSDLAEWKNVVWKFKHPKKKINIGIVGKYVNFTESYKSVNEALIHAGIHLNTRIIFHYIDAENIKNEEIEKNLKILDGILVPGGFGERGINGKIASVKFARENLIPYFGICLGLQIAVIEFSINCAHIINATSEEFDPKAKNLVIHYIKNQQKITRKGGTMRLGSYPCAIMENTMAYDIYRQKLIFERHRHRYEINNDYRDKLVSAGLIFSGFSPDKNLIEIIELKEHPFFLACQFHPEFLSNPLNPHPIFKRFIKESINHNEKRQLIY